MARANKFLSTISFIVLIFTSAVHAKHQGGDLEGEYIPTKGWIKSMEVSRPDIGESPRQIGWYRIKLIRKDWHELSHEDKKRIKKHLFLSGTYTGSLSLQTFTLEHTLVNDSRTGVIYTSNDYLLPEQGDIFCSSGVPLKGVEYIFPVRGEGVFSNLAGGQIVISGTVNNCPGQEDYLQNNFSVVTGQGSLVFEPKD